MHQLGYCNDAGNSQHNCEDLFFRYLLLQDQHRACSGKNKGELIDRSHQSNITDLEGGESEKEGEHHSHTAEQSEQVDSSSSSSVLFMSYQEERGSKDSHHKITVQDQLNDQGSVIEGYLYEYV